jgi:hypothetical protein
MRRSTMVLVPLCCAVAAAAACGKSDTPAVDTTTTPAAATPPAPPPPAALTLGDVAGKWNMRAVPDSGDTTATTYVLTASADSAAWSMQYPNGQKVAVHPTASGDSIILHAGPYPSVRRKGMQVTTDGVMRRQGDKLVGTTVGHYKTTRPDSVLHLHTEGTKAP